PSMKKIFTLLLLANSFPCALAAKDDQASAGSGETSAAQGARTDTPTFSREAAKPLPDRSSDFLSLVIDYGFNRLQGHAKQMYPSLLGSRVFKGAFHYNIQIKTSPCALSPGIGISWETYQLSECNKEYYTLARNASRKTILEEANRIIQGSNTILYSQLDSAYVDFLLEGRVHGNSQFPKEHLFAAVGFRIGVRYDTRTRIGYYEDKVPKRRTVEDPFNLSRVRYGVYGRLGWSRFGIYYNWTFSNLFKEGEGPSNTPVRSHYACASVDLF
ncbi:MAG: hypothetical protein AAFP93_03160, partial [Bacteroidota bacterium]